MTWNWQQPDWANWSFDARELEELEQQFLLGSGRLMGAWQHLTNEHKDQLKVSLLSDEAMKSSEIEGEFLDRDSVQSSVRRQFGMSTDRRSQPAESGIAELMVACFQGYGETITHKSLFHWHSLVCRGRTDLKDVGAYRTHTEAMQVVSGRIDRPKVHFEAPESSAVTNEMGGFLNWLQGNKIPALAKAGLTHLYFVSIHPFEDGNGRIARALSEHVFASSLGQPSLIALSYQIEKERNAYYDALEANNKTMEVTPWLIWFAETALKAQAYSIALIDHIIAKTQTLDRLRGKINPRQEKALLRLFDAGPEGFIGGLSAKNYISITGATTVTTTRDLNDLVAKSALTKTGERKGTRYWLKI
ncbi:Fic family protein [Pseudophaeobacter sp.]|uniref:Fic family protein n=1 Tax=Pseudophaeobacter sp. TaxID=1971739 RepID=UPI004059A7CA